VKNSGCARFSEGLRDSGGETIISLKLVGILSITSTWLVFYPACYKKVNFIYLKVQRTSDMSWDYHWQNPVPLISLVN